MKWITHQTGAVAAGLALQMPLLAVGAAVAGAILPDVLDQSISRMGRNKKQRQKFSTAFIGAIPTGSAGGWACSLSARPRPCPLSARRFARASPWAQPAMCSWICSQRKECRFCPSRAKTGSRSLFVPPAKWENTFFWPPLSRSAPVLWAKTWLPRQ